MRIERTKNATRNIVFGLIQRIYITFVPFLMRTAMIYIMGVQYLGLSSLFSSILQVLNLAELGVGNAMVYSMYKPIAEDNGSKICALMKLYKIYYRIIGAIIAGIGLVLTPFVPLLVKGDLPSELNIYILYLLNLGATVLSYWLFAYKNCLLTAHQRSDISTKISMFTTTIMYVAQFLVLITLHNYYVYIMVMLLVQALNNVITAVVVTKMYPEYEATGGIDKTEQQIINQRIKDLFTAKLGGVIVNSADTIVVSAFLGLTLLAIYQNYFYIVTSIIAFFEIVYGSCMAGIGNSIIVESKEKNFNDLNKLTFLINWLAGFCTTCLLCLYQPFMSIWVGQNLMLNMNAVVCFCIYFYVYEMDRILNIYKDAGGLWHEDRFRPLVTAMANLALNLLLVKSWGLYGVLLSTIVTKVFISQPWLMYNLFSTMFDFKQLRSYLRKLLKYVAMTCLACAITWFASNLFDLGALGNLIIRALICIVLSNLLFWIIYRDKSEFSQSLKLINKMTKNRLKFKHH